MTETEDSKGEVPGGKGRERQSLRLWPRGPGSPDWTYRPESWLPDDGLKWMKLYPQITPSIRFFGVLFVVFFWPCRPYTKVSWTKDQTPAIAVT